MNNETAYEIRDPNGKLVVAMMTEGMAWKQASSIESASKPYLQRLGYTGRRVLLVEHIEMGEPA